MNIVQSQLIMNQLLRPGLGLWVNEVTRATAEGKHTINYIEKFPSDFERAVVDNHLLGPGCANVNAEETGHIDECRYQTNLRLRQGD